MLSHYLYLLKDALRLFGDHLSLPNLVSLYIYIFSFFIALQEAESNRLCRRLQLKDIIPVEMQRLTKYPLLLENIAKYTGAVVWSYQSLPVPSQQFHVVNSSHAQGCFSAQMTPHTAFVQSLGCDNDSKQGFECLNKPQMWQVDIGNFRLVDRLFS